MRTLRICLGYLAILTTLLFSEIESRGRYPSLSHQVVATKLNSAESHLHRVRRSPSVDDREKCQDDAPPPPPIEVNTTYRLEKFREQMVTLNIDAFIIPMDDAHQSEYVSEHDERVQFISGYSGSAGYAVVLREEKAALWTDGRYFDQAEDELDCNWILMKQGEAGVPLGSEWLVSELTDGQRVGADPRTLSYDSWMEYKEALEGNNIVFEALLNNPVDHVWDTWVDDTDIPERPEFPSNALLIHDIKYAGETWLEKVERVRESAGDDADVVVLNYMDESAWLFNLRGTDVPYNPVFYSYVIIESSKVTLYLVDFQEKIEPEAIQTHLNVPGTGVCVDHSDCVNVKDYSDFYDDLAGAATGSTSKVWVSPMSSYAIYEKLGDNDDERRSKAYLQPSTVRQLKGRKNEVEVSSLRECHKRDSAILIKFIAMLEEEIQGGSEDWTEITASNTLDDMRRDDELNQGLSFGTISGFGANGAIIHYRAREGEEAQITTDSTYLLDSGGQYLDGTTDVTRTFHFGTPSDFQKEAYTRVLMGAIDLATTIWPNGTYGRDIDVMARGPQWSVGLDYRHGTGHGIGHFLNVHEGPGRINIGYRPTEYESPLYGEMFFSDEPGYYEGVESEDDETKRFGVRLETIVMTTKVDTEYQFGDRDYIGFEEFTLVPFEPHLIDYDLLNAKQRKWMNAYHEKCQEEIGPLVADDERAAKWLSSRTGHIPDTPDWGGDDSSGASHIMPAGLLAFLITVLTKLFA